MTNNFSESDNLFIMNSTGPGKCRLSANLSEYIDAILNKEDNKGVFIRYAEELGQGVGAILMNEFIEKTLENDQQLASIVNKSDMRKILMDNGHEMIKNTLDECLFSCLKDPTHSPIASLEMTINYDKDNVHVVFKDNGNGFPEDFINKFKKDNDIYQYLTGSGSHRKQSQINDLLEFKNQLNTHSIDSFEDLTTLEDNLTERSISPILNISNDANSPRGINLTEVKGFGGRGLGLRNLVANVMTGYPIQDIIHYNKMFPELDFSTIKQNNSSIKLSNDENGGATLEITIPLEPRKITEFHKLIHSKLTSSSLSDSDNDEEVNKSILGNIDLKLFKRNK